MYLRIDPEVGMGRADGDDRFESEGLELQRAVAGAYEEIAPIAATASSPSMRRAPSRRSTGASWKPSP